MLVSFTVISCSDDDNNSDKEKQSSITLNENESQELKKAILHNYLYGGEETGNYNFEITLYTTTGTIRNEYGDLDPDENEYSQLNIDLRSSTINNLNKGVYNYSTSEETEHFEGGEFRYNYDVNAEQAEEYHTIKGGQLEVIRNENPYEFKFEFILDDGATVKGYYKGAVDYIEY